MGNQKSSCFECFEVPDYIVAIKTGDTKGAGLHNAVSITLINEAGESSPETHLSGCCMTVFKRGHFDNFNVTKLPDFGKIVRITLQQHEDQSDVDWYIDKIVVRHIASDGLEQQSVFPVHRWLRANRSLTVDEYDCSLPQHCATTEQREQELACKRMMYDYVKKQAVPVQIKSLPKEEIFSNASKWDILKKKLEFWAYYRLPDNDRPEAWSTYDELLSIFKDQGTLPLPSGAEHWKCDVNFGRQRLAGCNPRMIELCKVFPERLRCETEAIEERLEGQSLDEAVASNRLFIVDYAMLEGLLDGKTSVQVPNPLALFYLNDAHDLLPVAIQLNQTEANAPVFVPSDDEVLWSIVKMWFNNADAAYHRACLHIMSTSLVLEGVAVAMHRNLSPSHPIFRLLGPYLKHILPITSYEVLPLTTAGGWFDVTTNVGIQGGMAIISHCWKEWRLDHHGSLPAYLESKGTLNKNILPEYPYRDDGLLLYRAIEEYVTGIVKGNYDEAEKLSEDMELQMWAKELHSADGCGIGGVPGEGSFQTTRQVIDTLTAIISISTIEHAAVNLPLYDEYAFIPNYPAMLQGGAPDSKLPMAEECLIGALPKKHLTMEIISVNKLLSERETSGLSDAKAQYQYDPVAMPAKMKFMGALREISATITLRNRRRRVYYDYLNPGVLQPNKL